ncbi:MAG: hypothetical protein LQ351_004898 [Letrouitia transgressa]|nr:MAG: hypothetical protein LQ351_004898 [Letrouitia transgressa]
MYFDCFLGGKFSKNIDEMYAKYEGPIVRINPWELHIKDPEYFEELYNGASKVEKDSWYYNFAGISKSAFATSSEKVHRYRRGAMAKIFSTSFASSVQPLMEARVANLLTSLQIWKAVIPSEPVELSDLFWRHASDIVSSCMMPEGTDFVNAPDTAPIFYSMYKTISRVVLWNRHLGSILQPIFTLWECIPVSVGASSHDGIGILTAPLKRLRAQNAKILKSMGLPEMQKAPSTIPFEIYSSQLPASEKSLSRINHEAYMITGAGTEATGAALSITTFYILSDVLKYLQLKRELLAILPSSSNLLSYSDLRTHAPYLRACIIEGLRLSKESNRMPRVNPSKPTYYGGYVIPAGTPISMSLRDVHLNETIFDKPNAFMPDRWLNGKSSANLEKYLVPFGRGSRACIGRHLALQELYLTLGNLFRQIDVELYETEEKDLQLTHDFFYMAGTEQSKGLRVLVK